MARTLHCSIVTPTKTVFEGAAVYASFPAWDGQHGVMPGQSPILTRLGYGSLRLDFAEGASRWYLVEGGFAQVADDRLSVLTRDAAGAETLGLEEAEAELAQANARVTQPGKDREQLERDQQRAFAKIALARQFASRGGAT